MCSWGHVAKNKTACSYEWRAHSTIALVCSTKTWHGQKRSSSGQGHKCQGGVQSDTNTGRWTASTTSGFIPIRTNLLNHCPLPEHMQENVTWKLLSQCHDILCFVCSPEASMLVPWSLYLHSAMVLHAWVELQLSLYDTKAASGSTWLEPWII